MLKWQLGRWREGRPSGAWLLDGKTDFQAAFPVHQLDPAALRHPASMSLQPLQHDLWVQNLHPCSSDNAPGQEGCMGCAGDGIQAAWLGHASVLVQMEGVTFLTDPVFSDRCSPVQWMGPR